MLRSYQLLDYVMSMNARAPSWDDLHEVANGQSGHFTAQQASEVGFSLQLLHKHVQSGNVERPMRGIYRIARFPPSEHEDLVVLWLWSDQEAVFSHETALSLHELSDALPSRVHLTLPTSTSRRRRIPDGVVVHFADMSASDRQWLGPVPVTRPARTVLDVAAAHGDASLVAQAIDQGIRRGLFTFDRIAAAGRYVADAQGAGRGHGRGSAYGARSEDASGRSEYHASWVEGTCTAEPPPDWPSIAAEIAGELGVFIHDATYGPSRTMRVGLGWKGLPDPRDVRVIRKKLARRFSWE